MEVQCYLGNQKQLSLCVCTCVCVRARVCMYVLAGSIVLTSGMTYCPASTNAPKRLSLPSFLNSDSGTCEKIFVKLFQNIFLVGIA